MSFMDNMMPYLDMVNLRLNILQTREDIENSFMSHRISFARARFVMDLQKKVLKIQLKAL